MIKTILMITLGLTICGKPVEAPRVAPKEYTMAGRYHDCGLVFSEDGNIWEYWQEGVADDVNVQITLHDNWTPEDIEDDVILDGEEDTSLQGDAGLYWLYGYKK
jgi:hypothetical protein